MKSDITIFEEKNIRRVRDEAREKRFFSIIDIVGILIEQSDHKRVKSYRSTLKSRLQQEGSEVVTNCDQLKLPSSDGKYYNTDVGDVETILRLVQSVPSPKAEPIKLRLAKVGYERMQETIDPSMSIDRARENRKSYGRSEKRIQQRMMGQETRNKLTDYWKDHNVKEGKEYAILTNIIHQERSGLSVKEHKNKKNLKSQNLRDHMSEAELIFTALAELSTRQIAEKMQTDGIEENKIPAKKGGQVAKKARKTLEDQTGQSVITGDNFLPTK